MNRVLMYYRMSTNDEVFMDNNKNDNTWRAFVNLLRIQRSETDMQLFLDLFLTPEEKDDIATRYMVVKHLLEDKKSQRDIAKELHTGIAKITRGSNELKRLNKDYLKKLKKLLCD